MKKYLLLAGLLAALAATGCTAADGGTGTAVTATGRLVLKGSMPMVRVVLMKDGAEQWELLDVPRETAAALQNREVKAQGRVERASRGGMLAPALRVESIGARDN